MCNSIWDQSKKKKDAENDEETSEGKNSSKEEVSLMYFKTNEIERRCLSKSEVRIDEDAPNPKITGYAAVFNTWADIGGWFKESIKPGAFAKTIKENDVRALKNHNEDHGTWKK